MEFTAPSETERELILNELKLHHGKVNETVLELKRWLSEQKHLPQIVDENVITSFAIFEKEGTEEIKKRLDGYFTIKSLFPGMFECRDPQNEDMKKCFETVAHGICSGYTPDYCRVYIAKLLNTDSAEFNFKAFVKRLLLLHDLALTCDLSAGIYILVDFSGVTVYHFQKMSFTETRELMFCFQNVYPVRIRRLVLLNVKPICKSLVQSLFFPLLKKKIRERTHIFSEKFDNIGHIIPMSILPKDMGGDGLSSNEINAFWTQRLLMRRTWILSEGAAKSDESKRNGRSPVKAPGCEIM